MFGLDNLIDAIFNSAVEQFSRNERVIKLLKKFNLDPDHPPADFTGVYQYALVEYGVDKPKPVLEIFRHTKIQQLFREALSQNNPAVLLQRGEAFLREHPLGQDIQSNQIDVRREFYEFATVFIEIAKRTRTPADILTNQKLDSLHRQISSLQERLHRLPTIEGMRTEMARLAAQENPALPDAESFSAEKCRAFALAQQMRGWLETLGYDFESYEVWEADYFEWIINYRIGRRRYSRALVRGIDGEIGLADVNSLRQSVDAQKADEGWLVTTRRISRAARDEITKEENEHLGCYTFDEFLDQDADFSGYLTWLEQEIRQRGIDEKYVPLSCVKEELDPDTRQRIGISRYDERDGWIDGYLDLWLDDPAKEHISILGEFGTGKTWFAFHYGWKTLQRYRDAQQRGIDRPRLPLVIPLRDYAKAVSVESLFSEFFFRKHEIPIPGYTAFEQLNRMGKLLLIFDGFDEMAARVDRQQMINNFWELAKVVVPGAKVILTCRTEHFPEAKEGRALLNAELQASTQDLTGETPQFEVLELEKFNDEQIRQVLSYQAQPAIVNQIMSNSQLLDLACRPVLTELILEALPDIEAGRPVDMSRVYLYSVRHKMERDIKAERTFTSMADKLYFMCELSWEMLSTDRMSINYREIPDRIRQLFGSLVEEEKDLDHWHYDMMGQTMLIRNADGDYTPAHRSLLEFFVAYKFAAELGALASDFLELLQSRSTHSAEMNPRDFTWSSYFTCLANKNRETTKIPLLNNLNQEPLTKLSVTFGREPLTKALVDLLMPIIISTDPSIENPLLKVIKATRGKRKIDVHYTGGNAATLLAKDKRFDFQNEDISNTIILGADFTNARLRDVDFTDADLTGSVFTKSFSRVWSVDFNFNDTLLAIGDKTGFICIWEVAHQKLISFFLAHAGGVYSVKFSPNNNMLVSCGADKMIKYWNINKRVCHKTLEGHDDVVRSISFSPDGQRLLSGSYDKTLRLWDIHTGECLKIFQGHLGEVFSVAFYPDGNLFASGSMDNTIRVWSLKKDKCLRVLEGHTDKIFSLQICSEEKVIASGGADKTIRLWDIHTGVCKNVLLGHPETITSIDFCPISNTLASASYDKTIKLWNIKTGKIIQNLQGHRDWIRAVAFSQNGKIFASGSDDPNVKIWSTKSEKCLSSLQGYANFVCSIAYNSQGTILASGNYDRTIKLWNIKTGTLSKVLYGHSEMVSSVSFNLTDDILFSSSSDGVIKIWDVSTGMCLKTLEEHTGYTQLVSHPYNQIFISYSHEEENIKIWDANAKRCLKTLDEKVGHANCLTISFDGKTFASSGKDGIIKLWNIDVGENFRNFSTSQGWINSISFHPNGKMIVSNSEQKTTKIWDVTTGKCFRELETSESGFDQVAFSPDGKILVGAGKQSIRIWETYTWQCLMQLKGHDTFTRSIVFSPDSKNLASGSWDGAIKLWSLETGECFQSLTDNLYEGMDISRVQGLTESEKLMLRELGAIED